MPSTRGQPKNRDKGKRKQPAGVVSWNDGMTMDYDNLKAMSVPSERPAGESSVWRDWYKGDLLSVEIADVMSCS